MAGIKATHISFRGPITEPREADELLELLLVRGASDGLQPVPWLQHPAFLVHDRPRGLLRSMLRSALAGGVPLLDPGPGRFRADRFRELRIEHRRVLSEQSLLDTLGLRSLSGLTKIVLKNLLLPEFPLPLLDLPEIPETRTPQIPHLLPTAFFRGLGQNPIHMVIPESWVLVQNAPGVQGLRPAGGGPGGGGSAAVIPSRDLLAEMHLFCVLEVATLSGIRTEASGRQERTGERRRRMTEG